MSEGQESLIVIDGPIGGRSDALAPFSESADASCLVIRSGEVDEATLKRFYRESERIRLQPANSGMQPIYVQDVEIHGVVIGVIRSLN